MNFKLGRDQLLRSVSSTFASFDISGSKDRDTMTAHGLRGTVISRLFECGHATSAVALRPDNRSLKSLELIKFCADCRVCVKKLFCFLLP